MVERPFVGREAEVAQLAALTAAAGAGRPQVVVVEGPPGIGKSALLDRLRGDLVGDLARRADRDRAEPALVLVAADRAESGLAYAVLSGVLAQLRPERPYEPVPPAADPFTVGLGLLGELGTPGLTAVLVDDAQWADPSSLRALLFALRRLRAESALVLLSVRTGEPLPEELARLLDAGGTVRMPLAGLDLPATTRLSALLLGTDLPAGTLGRLHAATGGNPLWLVAAAADAERLGRPEGGGPLPPPPRYAEIVGRQLAAASPDARALALAVAVTGTAPLPEVAPVYAAAGGSAAGWPDAAAAAAVADRLVTPVDAAGMLRPHHALTGSAAYWSLPAGRRAALHRAAAGAGADPERRLDHRCAADAVLGDDADLGAELVAHAETLRRSGNVARAAALSMAAAERAPGSGAAAALRTRAGLDLVRTGDLEGATRAAAAGAEAAETAAGLALRGSLALMGGRPAEAAALLRRGFETAGADRETAGMCAAQYTALIINLGLGEETLRWAHRSAELSPGDGVAQLMLHAAQGVLADGPGPWPEREAPAGALSGTLAGRGVQQLWRGHETLARQTLGEGVDVALREGPMLVGVIAGYYLAEACYRLGDLAGALRTSEANLSLAHDAEMTWTWTLAHATRVAPLVALGRTAEARDHLERARAASVGDFAALLWLAVAGARIALAEGDPGRALVALGEMEPHADAAGAGNPAVQPWRLLQVEALTATGREQEAEALLAPIEASLEGWQRPWAQVQAVRCRAGLARSRGATAEAEEVLAAGVADCGRHGSLEAALLRADLGGLLRRRGRRAAARAHLQAAYGALTAMGAAPAAALVDGELGALDGRAGDGILTGREREIADRVAQGATNGEIARALHVSVKTVEYHLGHAYAKLGVHSRGGVAAAVARHDGARASSPAG